MNVAGTRFTKRDELVRNVVRERKCRRLVNGAANGEGHFTLRRQGLPVGILRWEESTRRRCFYELSDDPSVVGGRMHADDCIDC